MGRIGFRQGTRRPGLGQPDLNKTGVLSKARAQRQKSERQQRKEIKEREKRKQNRNKSHTAAGYLSVICGIISIILILEGIFQGWYAEGQAGWGLGVLGLFAFVFALGAFLFGLVGKRDMTAIQTLPNIGHKIGLVMTILTIICWAWGFVLTIFGG